VAFAGRNAKPFPQAAGGFTVADAGRNAVVACGKDVAVFDKYRPDLSAQARGTCCDQAGDIHEILVP
jgi:hypothetical protein